MPAVAGGGGSIPWVDQSLDPLGMHGSPAYVAAGIPYSIGPAVDVVTFHVYEGVDDQSIDCALMDIRGAFEAHEDHPGFEYPRKAEYWHTEGNFDFLHLSPADTRMAWFPQMFTRAFAAGIRKVIRLAGDAGLLAAPPDYSLPGGMMVADAPTTVVTITVGGQTYRHAAEALGLGIGDGTSTPARDNLAAFVEVMTDITAVAGTGEVGEPIPFDPDRYRLQAMEANPADWGEPAPTVVDWPAGTGVVLAEAATCATATAEGVGQVLTAADQLTFFREGDVVYQVFAAGMLPGDAEC